MGEIFPLTASFEGPGLHDGETGNAPEVTGVQRQHSIPKMQRGYTDHKILERELDALGLLLALDAPHQQSALSRKRLFSFYAGPVIYTYNMVRTCRQALEAA